MIGRSGTQDRKTAKTTETLTEEAMGLFKGALKTGIVMKAIEIARREASKPENQRKAKELLARITNRGGRTRRSL
jgi:hypothetical protein